MVGMPIALLGHNHMCPRTEMVGNVSIPHTGGPIINTQQSFVTVYGIPVATVADKAICSGVGQLDEIKGGSSTVHIQGKKLPAWVIVANTEDSSCRALRGSHSHKSEIERLNFKAIKRTPKD